MQMGQWKSLTVNVAYNTFVSKICPSLLKGIVYLVVIACLILKNSFRKIIIKCTME